MTVSIPCASCAQQIRWGQRACTGCGRPISSDENRALEARFEAMHADFRNAKTSLLRGLTAALVAGLMIMTIAGLRVLLITQSFDPASLAPAVADFIVGFLLAACWLCRRRFPAMSAMTALLVWAAALVAPLLASPSLALIGIASPAGALLLLVRLVVLFVLARGFLAALQMRRFVVSAV